MYGIGLESIWGLGWKRAENKKKEAWGQAPEGPVYNRKSSISYCQCFTRASLSHWGWGGLGEAFTIGN